MPLFKLGPNRLQNTEDIARVQYTPSRPPNLGGSESAGASQSGLEITFMDGTLLCLSSGEADAAWAAVQAAMPRQGQ
ncbi:MAG: hypothetical protein ABSH00_16035 [Bryobacteraceae bacterium]|jgi:hypothetical protein